MKQLFINVIGHNASGKTTVAKRLEADLGLNNVNGDDFREFVDKHITYFRGTDISYPNERTTALSPLVMHYRVELSRILLHAGQSLLFDGSGSTKERRHTYLVEIAKDFPKVVRVIVWVDLPEAELLQRLAQRGGLWTKQYMDIKKNSFQPPEDDEAELVLRYDQHNYDAIRQTLQQLLHKEN